MSEVLYLRRRTFTDKSTIGELSLQDGSFQCYTLEDKVRRFKISKETAIPAGIYEIAVTYSGRFNRPMPLLLDVPFFKYIRIHNGNTPEHTEGCILVGNKYDKDAVYESKIAFEDLFFKIMHWVSVGKLFIKIEGGYSSDLWLPEQPKEEGI